MRDRTVLDRVTARNRSANGLRHGPRVRSTFVTTDRSAQTGVLLALLAALLWGVSGAVAAGVFTEISPARVVEVRALLTTAVLVPYAWWRGRLAPGGNLRWYALLGLNLAVVNVTFYWAIDLLGVGPGATIQFLGPIFVLAWMVVVQDRKVSSVAWFAAVLAVIGVGMVTEAWSLNGSDWRGVATGLVSAVAFASYLLLAEHFGRRQPIVTVMTWSFIFAALFWVIVQPLWTFPTDLAPGTWGQLVWIAIAGTAIPFVAEFNALKRVSAGVVGVIATTEPVIGAAAAWVLLEQHLSGVQIVGGVMVLLAVASIQRWGLPRREVPLDAAR
jgi:drug/metabolite transporter (DMT)-like permease